MNRNILFLFAIIMFTIPLCAIAVDEFKAQKSIDDTQPLFAADSFEIKADDGTKFVINTLNTHYDKNLRNPSFQQKMLIACFGINGSSTYYSRDEFEVFCFLLCPGTEDILVMFDAESDYLQKYGKDLKIEKYKDFENVTAYYFTYQYYPEMYEQKDGPYEPELEKELVWIDKNKDTHVNCGSFVCPSPAFNPRDRKYQLTDEDRENYEKVKDLFIYLAESEIKRCTDCLENDIDYVINDEAFEAALTIRKFNEELGEQLLELLEELRVDENKSVSDKETNLDLISLYVLTVSEFKNFYKQIATLIEYSYTDPDIQGELPINDEELQKYLAWQMVPYQEGAVMDDYFDTPVRFKIVPEGVKVMSAGRDRIWGTDDDQEYIRTYESAGMKPLND